MPRKKTEKLPVKHDSEKVILQELDKCFQLHDGQQILSDQVFIHRRKRVFAQCGRNWGKSVSDAYNAVKYALLNPNSACFISCLRKLKLQKSFGSLDYYYP